MRLSNIERDSDKTKYPIRRSCCYKCKIRIRSGLRAIENSEYYDEDDETYINSIHTNKKRF